MKSKILCAALALSVSLSPLCGQEDPSNRAAAKAEAKFYKAFWLEKGERRFAEAIALYDEFLKAAPESRLARKAATLQFELLTRTGRTERRATADAQNRTLSPAPRPNSECHFTPRST